MIYQTIDPSVTRNSSYPQSLSYPSHELSDYSGPQVFSKLQAVLIKNCSLKGRDLVPFQKRFIPIVKLWPEYRKKKIANNFRQALSLNIHCWRQEKSIGGICCSLASHPSWESNLFHWFLDLLPRVLAAESIVNTNINKLYLLKPGNLLEWQRESLKLLGYNCNSIVMMPDSATLSIKTFLYVDILDHRASNVKGLPDYPIYPYVVTTLKQRFLGAMSHSTNSTAPRIIITRNTVNGRSFLNMIEIEDFARANGFLLVDLACLSLYSQIRLFQNATHIIAAHGAGLTHLIHSTDASVLEIHSNEYGVRSEYFQIAAINNLKYYYCICQSEPPSFDMSVDIQMLELFMESSCD